MLYPTEKKKTFIGSIWQETTKVCFNVLSQLSLKFSNQNSVEKYARKTRLFCMEVLVNFGIVAAAFFWDTILRQWKITLFFFQKRTALIFKDQQYWNKIKAVRFFETSRSDHSVTQHPIAEAGNPQRSLSLLRACHLFFLLVRFSCHFG